MVAQTGGLIVSGGNIIVGSTSSVCTGRWTMAGGVLTNNGVLYVGEGIQPGTLVITNTGMWCQNGATYIGSSASAPGTGTMTVANGGLFLSTNKVFVAAVGGSNAVGMLTISNATFISTNAGTAFIVGTNGSVTVCGTQRVFQVAAFTNYFQSVFSNNIAQQAGGLDIISTNANALGVAGTVSLVYAGNPVVAGNYWGLRWANDPKTNHVAALQALTNAMPPRLTWNDSALSPSYQNQINIYTGSENSVAYTYVGINVATVISNSKGMAIYFR